MTGPHDASQIAAADVPAPVAERARGPVPDRVRSRIVLVANPISGRGRAGRVSARAAESLSAAGFEVTEVRTRLEPTEDWLDPEVEGRDVLVVVGGDGAVRLAAPSAMRTGVPIYHLPLGTENLFAREFGTDQRDDRLIEAIRHGRTEHVDAAEIDGDTFTLMASVGFDADVVHDLAARRRGAITHLSYAMPIARRALAWRAPTLDIRVDGERVAEAVRGTAIVANCRQYGGRLDPAADASMTDGQLDVVVLPARGPISMASWALSCRIRRVQGRRGFVRARGAEIEITVDPAATVQVDGDQRGTPGETTGRFTCRVRPRALPVLVR